MINNGDVSVEHMPKEWVDWVNNNGDNLRNILEEVEDFIDDRINSEDFEWVNTDLSEISGFIKFVLYTQWQKDNGYIEENDRIENMLGIKDINE
jgi:hypothetical protein